MAKIRILFVAIVMSCVAGVSAQSFDLGGLLGGILNNSGKGNGSSFLDGVLQNENIEVKDIVGTWTVSGPAIMFKSDNLLERAGGAAAATAVEEKLYPYYEKIGIDGLKLIITKDGKVTVKLKNDKSFEGTVTKGEAEGEMIFSFSKLAKDSKFGKITTYVTKTTTMSVMLDISKLQPLLSEVAEKVNVSSLSTVTSLLENYEGIYGGLRFTK